MTAPVAPSRLTSRCPAATSATSKSTSVVVRARLAGHTHRDSYLRQAGAEKPGGIILNAWDDPSQTQKCCLPRREKTCIKVDGQRVGTSRAISCITASQKHHIIGPSPLSDTMGNPQSIRRKPH